MPRESKRAKGTIYFGGLDGAVGDDGGRAAYAHSAPLLMTALLLNGKRPLLSQVQAFDNDHLLTAISDGSTTDSRALLRLVRSDDLRVRLYRGGLSDEPGALEHASLGNAFCTALERGAGFRLSAWPELERDPDARRELAAFLRAHEDAWDRLDEVADGPLLLRLIALSQLDISLIESQEPELAVPREDAPAAYARIDGGLARMATDGDHEAEAIRRLRADGADVARRAEGTGTAPQDNRTRWRRLIEVRAAVDDVPPTLWVDALSVVDIAYHQTIGDSLAAGSTRVPGTLPASEAMVRDEEGATGADLVAWGEGLKRKDALTWTDVEKVLREVDEVRGPQRAEVVAKVTAEHMVAERRKGHWLTQLAFKLPEIGAGGVAAIAGGAAGLALGGGGVFLVSAPVVASVRAALIPVVRRSEKVMEDRMVSSILTRASAGRPVAGGRS
ncbi:MAG TPA: hypothetical protein VF228_08450 [Iamia sp.]